MADLAPTDTADRETDPLALVLTEHFGCRAELAKLVSAKARRQLYPARATIIENGAASQRLYVMIAGHARMVASSIDGRIVVAEEYYDGALFGEGGLFEQPGAGAEVCAVAPCATGGYESHEFLAFMTNYGEIALAVSRQVIARLQKATRHLTEGATLSAAGRIHAEILRRARAADAMTITPRPVFAEVALAVRSTRETVSRTISALEQRGIVKRGANCLIVVAPHRLEELIY